MFESCYELKEAFERLLRRPDSLMLVTGELFPTSRGLEEEVEGTEMTGVEHLGQYVYEMTQAKLVQLNGGKVRAGAVPQAMEIDNRQSGVMEEEKEEDEDGVPPEELED